MMLDKVPHYQITILQEQLDSLREETLDKQLDDEKQLSDLQEQLSGLRGTNMFILISPCLFTVRIRWLFILTGLVVLCILVYLNKTLNGLV